MTLLTPRFLINQNTTFTLNEWIITDKNHPSLFNHIAALRLRVGETIALIDGEGQEWHAKITTIEKKQISFDIFAQAPSQSPFYIEKKYMYQNQEFLIRFDISLFIALIAQQNLDFLLQKATELGVQNIELLDTDFSQRLPAERMANKMQHWQHILQHACEQSGRNHLPTLKAPQKLKAHLLQGLKNLDNLENLNNLDNLDNLDIEFSHTFIFAIPDFNHNFNNNDNDNDNDNENDIAENIQNIPNIKNFSSQTLNHLIENFLKKFLEGYLKKNNLINAEEILNIVFKINAYIGPEGGFSTNEHTLFAEHIKNIQSANTTNTNNMNASFYSLGKQILRAETAALAFLSACYLF